MMVPENHVKKVANEEGCWESMLLVEPDNGYTVCVLLVKKTTHCRSPQRGSAPCLLHRGRGEGMKQEGIGPCRNNAQVHPLSHARTSYELYKDYLTELSKEAWGVSTDFTPSVSITFREREICCSNWLMQLW